MTRHERLQYEMFLRVRDFGRAHRQQFPESSTAGQALSVVAAAAAAIEAHASALAKAVEALQTLDVVVSNTLKDNSELLGVWKRDRRVSPKGKSAPTALRRPAETGGPIDEGESIGRNETEEVPRKAS